MTISPPSGLLGVQRPRVLSVPERVSSASAEAVDLAASVGLVLDPWQVFVLEQALGERADGKWSAFEVGLIVSRQNGKGAILEARELAGLFLFGEQLILHSAHEFKTAQEAFRRVLGLVEGSDFLSRRVLRVRTSHGEEGIELRSGARLRFVARSGGSGRGFSGDCVILDEAMILGPEAMAALLPTLSARPNPQLWYTASAGSDGSLQLARVRERGLAGGDPGLCFLEWSAPAEVDLDDRQAWAQANPALGIRISEEFVERERAALPGSEFARERLGIWDGSRVESVFPAGSWDATKDGKSRLGDHLAFAVDSTPDRSTTAIAVGGPRGDGKMHGEIVQTGPGVSWAAARLAELVERHGGTVCLDPAGPAGSLIPALAELGIEPRLTSARDVAQACGLLYDLVTNRDFAHLGQPELDTAVQGASTRPLGDAWAWSRKGSEVNISPLVAVTLAVWAAAVDLPEPSYDVLESVW